MFSIYWKYALQTRGVSWKLTFIKQNNNCNFPILINIFKYIDTNIMFKPIIDLRYALQLLYVAVFFMNE